MPLFPHALSSPQNATRRLSQFGPWPRMSPSGGSCLPQPLVVRVLTLAGKSTVRVRTHAHTLEHPGYPGDVFSEVILTQR